MITSNGAQLDVQGYDFVVIGGGTAGLVVAGRLSEDPSISVLVLEAGENTVGDPKVAIPAQFGLVLGDPKYDWGFQTTEQKHSNGKRIGWSRGRGLGGSSSVNFYVWVKPPSGDIDAIEKLGNPGWNWNEYAEYSKKSETFSPASEEQCKVYPHTYDPKLRGTSGPIQVTVPTQVHTVDTIFHKTLSNLGVRSIPDPSGGDISGAWICPSNLDRKTWTRSYAATGYLMPVKDRSNLTVVTGAFVSRILFADGSGGDLVANGVEFIIDEQKYTVKANKEVVLSAGTIKSPQVLELSGIGQEALLKKLGIDVKLNLPGVGENVQDHTLAGITYELNKAGNHSTLDLLRDPEIAAAQLKLHGEGKGLFTLGLTAYSYIPYATMDPEGAENFISTAEKEVAALKAKPDLAPGLAEQLDIQLATVKDPKLPDCEIVAFPGLFSMTVKPEPGSTYLSLLGFVQHPFSRGSIHVTSTDPKEHPEIDAHYYEQDIDLECLLQQLKFIRRAVTVEPLKSALTGVELEPGPSCDTDEKLRDFIKNTHLSSWHAIGSCSMLPREKNGVVDPELKVYGTTNLRVVDISVIPIHFAAHTQTTAYVVGEKAAAIIKKAHGLKGN